jgi:hypothetical protein
LDDMLLFGTFILALITYTTVWFPL